MKRQQYLTKNKFGKEFFDALGVFFLVITKTIFTLPKSTKPYGFAEEFYPRWKRRTPEFIEPKQNQDIH